MFRYFVNSEYKPLKAVLLCQPCPEIENSDNPLEVLHLKRIDYAGIKKEYEQIVKVYKKLKIKVLSINSKKIENTDDRHVFNLIFTRDLFFMTPRGAIMAKMFSDIRRDEVQYAERTLISRGVCIRKSIQGSGTFEGADALWVNDHLVVVGIGKRTNAIGFQQLEKELKRDGIRCVGVPAPVDTLHLLGALQFVDSDLALVRIDLVQKEVINFLKKNKISIIAIPENTETVKRQAMNFVVAGPKKIIMASHCPQTKKNCKRASIKIAAEIPLTQLVNGGGGLACATGILARFSESTCFESSRPKLKKP